jgi:sulfoxide reductase heme-binding subunit YedZ
MKTKYTPLQIAVHVGAWLPLAWLAWAALTNNLTVNPIQAATQHLGKDALVLLLLALSCTPLNTVFGFRHALKVRRTLGLYTFLYAGLHLLILIGLDYGFALDLVWGDLAEKPYIIVGASTLLILSLLAITSFKWWMKRLGKNWKRLHRLIYLAAPLAILHYAWAKKGDLFSLRGDILQPLLFGLLVVLLLLLRLPAVSRRVVRVRQAVRHLAIGARQRSLARRTEAKPS